MIAVLRNELRLWFLGASGWVFGALFLFSTGLLFVSALSASGEASLRPALGNLAVVALFTVPLLTLRQLAEEARAGTLELLLASPVTPAAILVGKWLASVFTLGVLLAWTAPLAIVLAAYGDPDPAALATGWLGWWIAGSTFAAVGLACSASTRDPTAAGALAVGVLLPSWLASVGRELVPAGLSGLADRLALVPHLRGAAQGTLDSGELAWFAAITAFALLLAFQALERRRLSIDGAERVAVGANAVLSTLLAGVFLAGSAELAARHPLRLELAADGGLDPDTVAVFDQLDGRPVEIVAFAPRQQDRDGPARERALRDHLRALEAWPEVSTRYVDLDREPAAALDLGVDRYGTLVVRSGGQRADLTDRALFSSRGGRAVSFVGEAAVTAAVRRVLDPARPRVYATRGHGEREPYDRGLGTLRALSELVDAQGFDREALDPGDPFPDDAAAVLILGPTAPLSPAEDDAIRGFLARGGAVGLFLDAGSLLPRFAEDAGVSVGTGPVTSPAHQVGHPERPRLVIARHPATEAILAAELEVAVSAAVPLTLGAGFTTLVATPSGGPERPGAAVAAAREDRGRLLVVGDLDLVDDELLGGAPGNGTLVVGLLRWLVGEEVPATPVGRGRSIRMVTMSERELDTVRALVVGVVPLAWCLLGAAVVRRRW